MTASYAIMVKLIYGMAGTGKSTLVYEQIASDLKNGKRVLLLTPEQQAVLSEQALAERAKDVSTLKLDVLSFRRLANHVSRMYGGLRYRYLDDSGKYLVLWASLLQTAGLLTVYKKNAAHDIGFLERLHCTFSEFMHAGIGAEQLEHAAVQLMEEDPKIAEKLKDLSLIFATYQTLLHKDHDDPAEDLLHLEQLLKTHRDSFAGYHIYLDSFQGYTEQELRVLRYLLPQADAVTITLCYDPTRTDDMLTTARKTEKQIKRILAACNLPFETIMLHTPHRFQAAPLAFLADHLYHLDQTTDMKIGKDIQILACNTPMGEAETVAREVIKCTMQGLRYREIAIVTRDVSRYAGVLDAVLETYNIPHFFSVREPLSAKPVYRLILGALDILRNHWKLDDVTAYIKTGLVGIPDTEYDVLLGYLERWNIYGNRWTDSAEWNMNPDGYTDQISSKSDRILNIVSKARWAVYRPLATLHAAFREDTTVTDALRALVQFLEELDIPSKIRSSADQTATQLYNGLMRSFDQIDAVVGHLPINITILSQLLSCVISHTDLGSIPSYVDQVIVGDAALLRTNDIKHTIIIGANEGAFPKSVTDTDLFSETERIRLETHDIFTVDTIQSRTNDELFYVYRACTLPSQSLTVTYHTHDFLGKKQNPSLLVDRILALFSHCRIIDDQSLPLSEKIYHLDASFSDAILHKNTPEGAALYELYQRTEPYAGRIRAFEAGLSAKEDVIPETALTREKDIVLSQSRFEKFVLCPFQYHCKYTLKLTSSKNADFSNLETGNFVHRILELVLKKLHNGTEINTDVSKDTLAQIVDEEISRFIKLVVGNAGSFTKRLQSLFRKLRQTILLLLQNILDEFSQSKFVPQFFEMDMSEDANPYVIPLPDGTQIKFRGKVDRVDTYVTDDKKVYLRVVDYKTSTKKFNLADIMLGINLQMLIYLFGLWQDPPKILRSRVGDTACTMEYLPAGVLYHTASTSPYKGSMDTPKEIAIEHVKDGITRHGLLLFDEAVLSAMEAELAGKYIPVTAKSLHGKTTPASLETLEGFGRLMGTVNDIVAKIVTEMKEGVASASPLVAKEPCKYCEYIAICRAKKSGATNEHPDSNSENIACVPHEE